jgi:hypothetical protein
MEKRIIDIGDIVRPINHKPYSNYTGRVITIDYKTKPRTLGIKLLMKDCVIPMEYAETQLELVL